ncbi:MAG: ATP-binding protein [Chloroflexota bacterium]|nr:ATP-binding protein [Chloroflexota bacterium]
MARQSAEIEGMAGDQHDRARGTLPRRSGAATYAFIAVDRDWTITYIDTAALSGAPRSWDDLLGTNLWEAFPDAVGTPFYALYHEAMTTGGPVEIEDFYPPFQMWLHVYVQPSERGLSLYFHDISERKVVEENLDFLAQASKILSSSLDYETTLAQVARLGVPRIADWCSVDMRVEGGAIKQLAITHRDPEKVQWAKELNEANPPDPDAPTGVPNVLRTGQSEFYPEITDAMLVAAAHNEEELTLMRKIGFSSVIVAPMRVQDETIGAITFVSAESGRFYTPSDLAMAEEVANRAALAVANARLYTEAQRAIAVRDEFMSLASHELKTPVTSLKMYTQVLQRQAERRGDSAMTDRFVKMDRQIDKLTGLINDLLNVARIEGGRLEYLDESLDLNAVVQEAVEAVQPITDKHTIAIEGEIDTPVWGDGERIGQVITNLLTNAIKYSPQADRVIVRLAREDGRAMISVQDFGIGIDEAHQPKVFDQFYRVSDPSEKTFPGLGLGLHIANEIVKRHGGTLHVRSVKDAGATFTVIMPLVQQNRADGASS